MYSVATYFGAPSAITTWKDLFFFASKRNLSSDRDRPSVKITSLFTVDGIAEKSHEQKSYQAK
jgi:hypothetical protein